MTARLLPLALLVAGLAACAGKPASVQDACARQAEDDPKVRSIIIKGLGNPHYRYENQDALNAAQQAAVIACLRRRGVISKGGVEAQKPIK